MATPVPSSPCGAADHPIKLAGPASISAVVDTASPLTSQERLNLQTFTKLYGLVRFFHPSQACAQADWNVVAVEGTRRVLRAANNQELAQALGDTFGSVAPTLSINGQRREAIGADTGHWLMWNHSGVGLSMVPYESIRVVTNRKLHEAYTVDLPGDIHIDLPLNLPSPTSEPPRDVKTNAQTAPYSGDERATRLADIIIVWNTIYYFFPYFDLMKCDWDQHLLTMLENAATTPDKLAFHRTLQQMVQPLQDGHSQVNGTGHPGALAVLPEEKGKRYYLPPFAWALTKEGMVVTGTVPSDGKTDLTRLERGCLILEVDGRPVEQLQKESASRLSGTPQFCQSNAPYDYLFGLKDTPITLKIQHPNGQPDQIRLTRIASAATFRGEFRPAPIAQLNETVMYFDATRVAGPEFDEALPRLAAAQGLVVDLRGYPKGPFFIEHVSEQPIRTARLEVPQLDHPDTHRRTWKDLSHTPPQKLPRLPKKMVFLTDSRAISFTETLLGIVEAYQLGPIVGSNTAGCNGNINIMILPGGYNVPFTGMRVRKHDGSQHHLIGIKPNREVEVTRQAIIEGRDEVLEAGLQILSQMP